MASAIRPGAVPETPAPGGARSLVCLLPNNTWALVPEWMTSREACARCQLTESPEVSLSALFELGATLDALPLTRPYSTISSETHLLEEEAGEDGAKTRECRLESPAARAGVGGAHRLGTSTGADPASASRRIGATADATRGRRGCGGGGR